MSVCTYCNGLKKAKIFCPYCSTMMEDKGKISDYYLNYSPYREIDELKMTDGYNQNFAKNECIHYLHCPLCGFQEVISFEEEEF